MVSKLLLIRYVFLLGRHQNRFPYWRFLGPSMGITAPRGCGAASPPLYLGPHLELGPQLHIAKEVHGCHR